MGNRFLKTRCGSISFPAYMPVTTFGNKYPLDKLVQPYLNRLAPGVMVSHYYAQLMEEHQRPQLPLLVDSGGFAALFDGTTVRQRKGLGILETKRGDATEILHPRAVLEFQEKIADVAFTLDFPIPPKLDTRERHKRHKLTIANALWAIENRRRRDLPLYACIQAWDKQSALDCAKAYELCGFDGIAIGGLVPRAKDMDFVLEIVRVVREVIGDLPLHVFGLGHPDKLKPLFDAGVDSVDSSSYIKYAAQGKLWSNPTFGLVDPSPTDRLHLALCNLASAVGKSLPLSTSEVMFETVSARQG